ncbi:MAG TPA: hypothetical protein V6D29_25380 [Leptolyngbyaceae cyanobacterium]
MKLVLGQVQIELLEPSPSYDGIPSGQANTYRLLMELVQREKREVKAHTLLEALGLKSLMPLASRIEHLQERGLVRLKKCLTAAT